MSTLQIAQDWLASTGIQSEENPRLFVANMTNGSAYAAKATMVGFPTIALDEVKRLTCSDDSGLTSSRALR